MRLFNIDLHVSVIADLGNIFHHLGHEVTSWTLSSHAWVFGRERNRVEVVNENTWTGLSKRMCRRFLRRYHSYLAQFDGFIVTYPPAFYLLYRKLSKPVIVVASTRYEYPFSFERRRWQWLNAELRKGIDRGQVIPVANNRYDAAYAEYFTGRPWRVIPSLCKYTNAHYTGSRREFIYQSKFRDFPVSPPLGRREEALPERYQWQELFDCRGIVHIPYNVSTMSIFEQYTAGMPLFFPTQEFLLRLYHDHWQEGVLSEISYHQVFGAGPGSVVQGNLPGYADPNSYLDLANVAKWVSLSDFYDSEKMPGINYFGSARQLHEMLADFDPTSCIAVMRKANKQRQEMVYSKWNAALALL